MVKQCRITGKLLFFLPIITACGFVSATGQIIILREFLVLFYGNELTIGLIFAAWLLWTALGSTVGGRCGVRLPCHASLLPVVLALFGLLLPVSVLWIRACLLYTSDAADDPLCVDLGGCRIIKKKPN